VRSRVTVRGLWSLLAVGLVTALLGACAPAAPAGAPTAGGPAVAPARAAKPGAAGGASAARGDTFAGKTLTVLVNYSAGGPADVTARLMAQYLDRHIPGRPTIIVENKAGAGGIIGMNYLYNVARKDGLTLGVHTPAYAGQMLGAEGAQFDEAKFLYLGALSESQVLFANANLGARTLTDLTRTTGEIVAGGLSPDSSKDMGIRVVLNLVGAKYKYVTGYPGSNDVRAAFQRGEVNLSEESLTGWATGYAPFVKDGTAVPLGQRGLLRGGEIVRDERFVDVPTYFELATGQRGDEAKQSLEYRALATLVGTSAMSREFIYPPGTDAALVDTMRQAMADLFADPEFLAAAEKLFSYRMEFLPGAEAQDLAQRIVQQSSEDVEAVEYLRRLTKQS
jgi:tripartite-type tricarboxylate transporter receptor subunit TctC